MIQIYTLFGALLQAQVPKSITIRSAEAPLTGIFGQSWLFWQMIQEQSVFSRGKKKTQTLQGLYVLKASFPMKLQDDEKQT